MLYYTVYTFPCGLYYCVRVKQITQIYIIYKYVIDAICVNIVYTFPKCVRFTNTHKKPKQNNIKVVCNETFLRVLYVRL